MIEIKVLDFKKLQQELKNMQKDIPFAMAYTLTQMGQAAKAATAKEIKRVFDRPKKWTVESTYLKPATKNNLRAIIWIKEGSLNSLAHHVTGGQRPAKEYEKRLRSIGILRGSNQYTVPSTRLKLDNHGNLSRGKINKILSSVGAQRDSLTNTTRRSISRNKSQNNYFVVSGQRRSGTPSGIYETKGRGENRRLLPVLLFVKSARYKTRYRFYEVAEDAAHDAMPKAINKALDSVFRKAGFK
jgi:hypothetical protein